MEWIDINDKLPDCTEEMKGYTNAKRSKEMIVSNGHGLTFARFIWYGEVAMGKIVGYWDCPGFSVKHWLEVPKLPGS